MKRWRKHTVYIFENNKWTEEEYKIEKYSGKIHITIESSPGTRKEIYTVWLNDGSKDIVSYDRVNEKEIEKIMNNYILYRNYYYGLKEIKQPECYKILSGDKGKE